jgi:elongation factor 1 alpha-like protein
MTFLAPSEKTKSAKSPLVSTQSSSKVTKKADKIQEPSDSVGQLSFDVSALGFSTADANVRAEAAQPPKPVKSNVKKLYSKEELQNQIEKRQKDEKARLNLVIIGHVDSGKSTLMGHLLCLLGKINQRTIKKFEKESESIKKGSFHFAWVLDETEQERSRYDFGCLTTQEESRWMLEPLVLKPRIDHLRF